MKVPQEFQRDITLALDELANSFPIVCITGPRQSGKTTLTQQYFPEKAYFNLEDPSQRALIMDDPKGILLSLGKKGAIFDEIQHFPALLSYLQVEADKQQIKGQFILTGSYNLALMESVTQSLAGRVGLLELLPMSTQELIKANIQLSTDELLYYGGLPRIFRDQINPTLVYKNYVKTYIERDMRNILHVKDLMQFQRFMQLCAARIGTEFIASNIGNELGVSYHTVQSWLSVLEASYIIFRLQPYFENFGKRIIKSPKLYFTDVGLASYLLGIENISQMSRDPLKGNLFENLVILDFYKQLLNQGKEPRIYFYRDRSQYEVDLIWQSGRDLIPIEIKYGQTYKTEFVKGLNYFKDMAKERVPFGYVIFTGESSLLDRASWRILNYREISDIISHSLLHATK
ncbi:MAG: ATP-binding protein [Gammaproteobacteria bacterium]|nr:ATP-binding protein [Gammaproteobacteria bacterium]